MSAAAPVYEVSFRMSAGSSWEPLQYDPGPGYAAVMAHADALASVRHGVRVRDPWTLLAEWSAGKIVPVRLEAPGHPDGCSCGECAVRAAHAGGGHEGKICRHGTCERCAGCPECDDARAWAAEVTGQRTAARGLIGTLEDATESLRTAARALQKLYRLEGIAMPADDYGDALAELTAAARSVRHATRIGRDHYAEVEHELRSLQPAPGTEAHRAGGGQQGRDTPRADLT